MDWEEVTQQTLRSPDACYWDLEDEGIRVNTENLAIDGVYLIIRMRISIIHNIYPWIGRDKGLV